MIPDAERLVSDYLRAETGARIVGKTPSVTSTPWVRVTLLNDRAVGDSRTDHLIEFYLQLDIYAGASGGQPEVNTLSRQIREALRAMPQASHPGAVVSGVTFASGARIPDSDFEPARERVIRNVYVYAHAT